MPSIVWRGEGPLVDETVLVAVVITTTQEARPDGTASLTSLPLPAAR